MLKRGHFLTVVVTLLTSVAWGESGPKFSGGGNADFYHTSLGRFAIDEANTPNPSQNFGGLRLGTKAGYEYGDFALRLALDFVSIRGYGDRSGLGQSLGANTYREPIHAGAEDLWLPRTAMVSYRSSVGVIQCGQQTAHWGLGLVIHDGQQRERFGRALNANTSMRCLFATKPISELPNLTTVFTVDAVYRDDNAQWRLGDRAYGGSLGIRYGGDQNEMGLLTSFRHQTDREDALYPENERTTLEALILDLFWRKSLHLGPLPVLWEGELATVLGKTNRPYLEETYEDGAKIQSLGGATAISTQYGEHKLRLEMGFASGDNDPLDDTIRTFSFHSSYGMGLIFVDHVLPALSARSIDRINDRDLIEVTPPSLRFLVNQGALQSTAYLSPTIEVALPWHLHFNTTYFYFAGGSDLVDVYHSNLNGGFNRGYGGESASGGPIGHELDIRLGYDLSFSKVGRLRFNLEGAVFVPGAALRGAIDTNIHAVHLTTHVQL